MSARAAAYGPFALVYDRLMADMPYGEWLSWLDLYWEAHGGRPASVADLGCGTGTIAISLAQSGIDVTGIDLSAQMIAVAREKQEAIQSEVAVPGKLEWLVGDVREWSLPKQVDAAISMCDCFSYLLSEEDLLRAFRRTYEGLKPGGTFLFDMHHANQIADYVENEPFCHDDEAVSYIWTCDPMEEGMGVLHKLVFFFPEEDGRYRRVEETHRQRAYPVETVSRLLQEAGFRQVDAFADFSFEPICEQDTRRMFFAAVKAET